jgi:hypothetical protein
VGREVVGWVVIDLIEDDMDCSVEEVFGSVEGGEGGESEDAFLPVGEVGETLA